MKGVIENHDDFPTVKFNVDFPPDLNAWAEIEAKKKGESKKLFVRKCVEYLRESKQENEHMAMMESKIDQLESKLDQVLNQLKQLQK